MPPWKRRLKKLIGYDAEAFILQWKIVGLVLGSIALLMLVVWALQGFLIDPRRIDYP